MRYKGLWKNDTGIRKDMSEKDHANTMISAGNEQWTLHKSEAKKKSTPGSDTEEITTVRE